MTKHNWLCPRWLGVAVGIGGCFISTTAIAADDTGKIYYKDGTTIETQDFNLKINLLVQPTFEYNDVDNEGRADLGVDPGSDRTSFDLDRVRARLAGDALNKEFSYALYHDFRADGGGSELEDAWLQWNQDWGSARWGQFDVAYSRQELNTDHGLQMLDRSIVSDRFSPARQMGALLHGPLGDGITYAVGAFNGVEGQNSAGVDNKLLYNAALTASTDGYGSRAFEGDLRSDNSSFEGTGGAAVYYLEGTNVDDIDVNQFGLNVDLGMKTGGLSAQTEFYYENVDADESDIDSADNFGFYVQGGYMLNTAWEVALRFGYVDPDDGDDGEDIDTEEYEAVVNYYINGHNMKLQSGVIWTVDNVGDDDVSDFDFVVKMTGWL